MLLKTVAGPPAELIVNYAKEIAADLIVMGTHGAAAIPVLLVRGGTSAATSPADRDSTGRNLGTGLSGQRADYRIARLLRVMQ